MAPDIEQNIDLFDANKLELISNWPDIKSQLQEKQLIARPLRLHDHKNGYLELLSQLTVVGDVSKESFELRFYEMLKVNQVHEHYLVVVIEDITSSKIVGASTLFLELKFIRQCALRGRLEDVCVLDSHRGKNIGALVVQIIAGLARDIYKCYKLTLDCTEEVRRFYEKIGFKQSALQLGIRY